LVYPGTTATGKLLDKEEEGEVQREGPSRPASAALGIVPHKNVLFPVDLLADDAAVEGCETSH
jgi:hypothetical protein